METKKEIWGSYTYIRQNRPENKDCNKRQKRSLYNDKGVNPTRGHNILKYLCTQYRRKQILTDLKEEIDSNTIIVGD